MGLSGPFGLIFGLCWIILHVNTAQGASNTTLGSGCVVWVPEVTAYQWEYFWQGPVSKVPTNSAGTHIRVLDITTGGFETEGKWMHLTTKTTLVFPTGFYAGAAKYSVDPEGFTSGSRGVWSFFSTVYSLPQWPPSVASLDPAGINCRLDIATTDLDPITRFQTLYPEIRQFQTCTPSSRVFEAEQPPGILNVAPLETPTFPSLTSAFHVVSTTISTRPTINNGPASKLSTTLITASSDDPIPERPSEGADRTMASSLSPSANQFFPKVTASTFHPSVVRSITAIPSSTGSESSTYRPPVTSPSVSSTSFNNFQKSPELPQVSIVSGTILLNGHTLRMSATLTLGSGSVLTEIALKTNSFGQTLVVGGASTWSQVEKNQPSPNVTNLTSSRSNANPAPIVSSNSTSPLPSSGAKTRTPLWRQLVQFWFAIWLTYLTATQLSKKLL